MSNRIQRRAVSHPSSMDPSEVPAIMRRLGLDKCIIFPNSMLGFEQLRSDDERMSVLAQAYTDYLLDQVVTPDDGIYAFMVAAHTDPETAADHIDDVADEAGIVGIMMLSSGPEPPLGNRRYDPIYAAAARNGLPVVFHAGAGSLDHFYIRGFEKILETHALGFKWSNEAQLTSVTIQGVPEKFPNLDIVFMESGVFWIPTMLHRLDAEYLKRQSEAPMLERRPSEYIREYYFGTQPIENPENEAYLADVFEQVGVDRLMYASDYPHWDYDEASVITDLSFLSSVEKQRVLAGTAEEAFGI